MNLFDLHCDTIVNYKTACEDFLSPNTSFNLKDLCKFDRLCQTMAVFIPDNIRGEAAYTYFTTHADYLNELACKQQELVQIAHGASDIEAITDHKKCALLLSVESGAALAGKIEHVKDLRNRGVEMMTLTWNGENELASGHDTNKGFTAFGRDVVKEMECLGITVDISHLNDVGFEELCSFASKPFVATHSNLRSICKHKRNVTEEQFKEIISRKGLIGLNLYQNFLSDTNKGTVDVLFRHVYRMLELGGEDIIACGSDFDGADIDDSLNSPYKFAKASEYFSEMGLKDDLIEKIFFQNALSFFKRKELDL